MDNLKKAKPSKKDGGDIFRTLSNAIEMLDDYVKKKKYAKKAFIFTNGSGKTKYDTKKLNQLGNKANNMDTYTNIVTIDFMEDDEDDEDANANENENQAENREFLQHFC
mmetsp:Transcript_14544/g.12352  ORF Transcript_14544/g.12352 Transcript_14544/m.12352 type:complete len:109 (+) Transcript_14544:307-633(+)